MLAELKGPELSSSYEIINGNESQENQLESAETGGKFSLRRHLFPAPWLSDNCHVSNAIAVYKFPELLLF
jgi:hypothetical protein